MLYPGDLMIGRSAASSQFKPCHSRVGGVRKKSSCCLDGSAHFAVKRLPLLLLEVLDYFLGQESQRCALMDQRGKEQPCRNNICMLQAGLAL